MDEIQKRVPAGGGAKAPLTTRLIFSYSGDEIKFVSKRTIQKISPVTDLLTAHKKESGFWYEVKDAKNTTIFRRVMQNPIKRFAEIRSDNADRPFTWEKVSDPSGVIVILFPAVKEAVEVVLFSSGPQEGLKGPAKVIARYSLKNDKKRKED
jgi:hypothetical protein